MAEQSTIEWTDVTWNPTSGCDRVSPGCDNCYALKLAKRLKGMGSAKYQRDGDLRTSGPGFALTVHPDTLRLPFTWREKRVFVNSMSDLFHDNVPEEYIARVFAVMAATPDHTYQVLTKRHGRMRSLLSRGELGSEGFPDMVENAMTEFTHAGLDEWPLPNVWLGVSAETQQWADIRIPALLDTPAAVRFVSAEPLLGPVDISQWVGTVAAPAGRLLPGVDWVIVGGESGRGSRPMHPAWARGLRDQCTAAGVPFFFKQHGEWGPAPWRIDRKPGESDEAYKDRAEAACATHSYPVWADRSGHDPARAGRKPWSADRAALPTSHAPIRRWGKRRAGRALDGRTWDEFPY